MQSIFWATVCKTVRPMLSDRCLSCLSVCDVGVFWPNGSMDQDATWHRGRPQPRPDCVRWGPSSPPQKKRGGHSSPHFSAHVYCGQTAGWIKMPLGTEEGLGQATLYTTNPIISIAILSTFRTLSSNHHFALLSSPDLHALIVLHGSHALHHFTH